MKRTLPKWNDDIDDLSDEQINIINEEHETTLATTFVPVPIEPSENLECK